MTQQLNEPVAMSRLCFVNCGKPAHECECLRSQMASIYAELATQQTRLGPEFEKAWSDNIEELYEP